MLTTPTRLPGPRLPPLLELLLAPLLSLVLPGPAPCPAPASSLQSEKKTRPVVLGLSLLLLRGGGTGATELDWESDSASVWGEVTSYWW